MQITFLGTSSGAPTLSRNMAGIVLRLPQRGKVWLFDCGEGTQHQALRAHIRVSQLEKIFITHLHGDHIFGLPGLLASRSLQVSGSSAVTLYGPAGLEEFVRTALRVSETVVTYPLEFVAVAPTGSDGPLCVYEGFSVRAAPASHRIEAFAYAVQEDDLPGTFDANRARELGVPFGPLFGRLKSGGAVTLADGKTVDGRGLVGPPRRGRKVVYTGDTTYSESVVSLAAGADVLIHEATFLERERDLAERAGHSTTLAAARAAKTAEVRTLILTHFSARYEAADGSGMKELLDEARALFPNTLLAEDMATYPVVLPSG